MVAKIALSIIAAAFLSVAFIFLAILAVIFAVLRVIADMTSRKPILETPAGFSPSVPADESSGTATAQTPRAAGARKFHVVSQ